MLVVLPIVAADAETLLVCLDCSFAESICFCMVGSGKAQIDVVLSVQAIEEL